MRYDLIVVGSTPAGLSVAVEARRAGLERVLVLDAAATAAPLHLADRHGLVVHRGGQVERIGTAGERLVVETATESFATRACVVDVGDGVKGSPPPWPVADSVADRVHAGLDFEARGRDVLAVGSDDAVAITAWRLVEAGARPVVCLGGHREWLSLVGLQLLEELEREQQVTVLWQSTPAEVVDLGGDPMVAFTDRKTPDLQFDHVAVVGRVVGSLEGIEVADGLAGDPRLAILGPGDGTSTEVLPPAEAWRQLRPRVFPDLPPLEAHPVVEIDEDRVRELAAELYNATITTFDTAHNELWRIRVRPDHAGFGHRPGQYCTLGLGYWEPRADDAVDPGLDRKREKLIRRSYSISSPLFDTHGYLADAAAEDELELYIVWVRPEGDRVPALTPRLALKHAGDRVYLGPKVAGRYTLDPVSDPSAPVLFCSTGTGEAPHNAMVIDLLRKGHHGPILNTVSVRYRSDLAYLAEHRRLEERYPHYRYLPIPTREPDVPKRYLQDLLSDGELEEALGAPLDPDLTHVFLCGNPAMIGLPEWTDDGPVFPETVGMCQLLAERGFTLDRRGVAGNVHYEEYW